MERLTTRHNGVAVIRDKSKHKEAMEKLCRIEELQEDDKGMCELTEEFASYICDSLCKYRMGSSQEQLDEYCVNCRLDSFIKDIMAEYNIIIDFDNTETMKLMTKYQGYQFCDECQYCEIGEEEGVQYRWCSNSDGLCGHLEPGTGCTRGERR